MNHPKVVQYWRSLVLYHVYMILRLKKGAARGRGCARPSRLQKRGLAGALWSGDPVDEESVKAVLVSIAETKNRPHHDIVPHTAHPHYP